MINYTNVNCPDRDRERDYFSNYYKMSFILKDLNQKQKELKKIRK